MTTIERYTEPGGLDEWTRDRVELVKRTYCKGATDDELALFVSTAQRTGLSPEARQIFAVKRWDSAAGREVMSTQTSIDGYRLIAQRSGVYAGQTPKQWCGEDGVWVDVWLKDTPPAAARAGVYRRGFAEPLMAVATFAEYAQTKKDGKPTAMWASKPALMLAKCAEALALRAAFPAELSGLYTAEEMGDSELPAPVPTPRALPADPETGEVIEAKATPARSRRRPPPNATPAEGDSFGPLVSSGERARLKEQIAALPEQLKVALKQEWVDRKIMPVDNDGFSGEDLAAASVLVDEFEAIARDTQPTLDAS